MSLRPAHEPTDPSPPAEGNLKPDNEKIMKDHAAANRKRQRDRENIRIRREGARATCKSKGGPTKLLNCISCRRVANKLLTLGERFSAELSGLIGTDAGKRVKTFFAAELCELACPGFHAPHVGTPDPPCDPSCHAAHAEIPYTALSNKPADLPSGLDPPVDDMELSLPWLRID